MTDLRAYRVNLICSCQNDVAYGFGPNEDAARIVAEVEFRRAHGADATYTQVVVEKATADGSRYEVERAALRYDFTDGLGSELDALAVEHGAGPVWAEAFNYTGRGRRPYYFESSDPKAAAELEEALMRAASSPGNRKLRETAAKIRATVHKIRKHLWGDLS